MTAFFAKSAVRAERQTRGKSGLSQLEENRDEEKHVHRPANPGDVPLNQLQ